MCQIFSIQSSVFFFSFNIMPKSSVHFPLSSNTVTLPQPMPLLAEIRIIFSKSIYRLIWLNTTLCHNSCKPSIDLIPPPTTCRPISELMHVHERCSVDRHELCVLSCEHTSLMYWHQIKLYIPIYNCVSPYMAAGFLLNLQCSLSNLYCAWQAYVPRTTDVNQETKRPSRLSNNALDWVTSCN